MLSDVHRLIPAERARILHRYGPWAVVTGASDGIGREFARRLAEAGLNVVLAARRAQAVDALGQELTHTCGVRTKSVPVDLSRPDGVGTLVEALEGIDVGILVACAGCGTSGPFLEGNLQEELAMVDLNCRSVAELAHVFGGRFTSRGRGGMVLMSSLVAFQGVPRAGNYAATKAYVQSFAEALGRELRPSGVDVLACAPGPVRSGFSSRARMTMGLALDPSHIAAETLRALGRKSLVRPGWLSKVLELALATLPRWGRVRAMEVVMAGMTPRGGAHASGAK